MKKVEIKVIRSDKKVFTFDNIIWGITAMSGFDSVDNEAYTESQASGDGSRYTGMSIKEKDRTIEARLMNASLNEVQRAVVVSFFNPKYTFSVYVTYQGRTRWCEGIQIGFKCPTENVYKPITLTWTILSTMPYMMSTENFGENIGEIVPMFGFPFRSIVGVGFGVGVFKFAKEVEIDNNGDVETFFQCSITATGDVEKPKLIKGDKYVLINDTLHSGDVYLIDFVAVPPTVKKNGVNAIGNVDRTSSLTDMSLEVGGDKFGFDAENGDNNMNVEIYRYERYLGI